MNCTEQNTPKEERDVKVSTVPQLMPQNQAPETPPPHNFTPIDASAIVSRAYEILAKEWKVLLPIAAMVYIFIYTISTAVMLVFVKFTDDYIVAKNEGWTWHITDPWAGKAALAVAETLFSDVLMCFSSSAIIRAVLEHYVDHKPTIIGSLQNGMYRLFSLSGSFFIIAFIMIAAVGLAVLTVYGIVSSMPGAAIFFPIFLILVWIFGSMFCHIIVTTYISYPIIVAENCNSIQGIRRSLELSKDHWRRISGAVSRFFLVRWCCDILFKIIGYDLDFFGLGLLRPHFWLDVLDDDDDDGGNDVDASSSDIIDNPGAGYIALQVLRVSLLVCFACYGSILQAVTYVSVRSDKEQLTKSILAQELGLPCIEDSPYEMMPANNSGAGEEKSPPVSNETIANHHPSSSVLSSPLV